MRGINTFTQPACGKSSRLAKNSKRWQRVEEMLREMLSSLVERNHQVQPLRQWNE